jgi:hypothetical protein
MIHSDQLFGWIMFGVYLCLWFNLCIWLWVISEWLKELADDRRHPERERRKHRQRELAKTAEMESKRNREP